MGKFEFNRKNVIVLILSAAFAFLATNNIWHVRDILSFSGPVILGIEVSVIFTFLVVLAGLIVMRPLTIKAGAGLSLIIFLALSYCTQGVARTLVSDQAMRTLVYAGLGYVIYDFLSAVVSEFTEQSKRMKAIEGRWEWKAVLMVIFLALFVIMFLITIFQALSPIVMSFCFYK